MPTSAPLASHVERRPAEDIPDTQQRRLSRPPLLVSLAWPLGTRRCSAVAEIMHRNHGAAYRHAISVCRRYLRPPDRYSTGQLPTKLITVDRGWPPGHCELVQAIRSKFFPRANFATSAGSGA